ncbi:MAG: hypothetical protein ACJ707_09855 [Nitrososphaera sp.]
MPKIIVQFSLPNALIEQGNYELLVQNKRVNINVVYEQNKERIEQMTGRFAIEGGGWGNVEITRDAHGIANISKVTMELPATADQFDRTELFETSSSIKQEYVMYFNRLVEVVRYVSRQYWITPISSREIIELTVVIENDNQEKTGIWSSDFENPLLFPLKTSEQRQVRPTVDGLLKSEFRIPLYESLFLDAVNYFETGKFNETVILANVVLEELVTLYLYKKLTEKMSLEKADVEIERIKKSKKFEKKMSFHFNHVDGRSLQDNDELWQKLLYIRARRKEAIHPRIKDINREEAYNTLEYTLSLSQWVVKGNEPAAPARS